MLKSQEVVMATRCVQLLCRGLAFLLAFAALSFSAQGSAPQTYTLTEISRTTEVSMFTGQASNLKIYRRGSKELVDVTVAPYAANPQGVHMSYLFDFSAHKAFTRDLDHKSCSWMRYVSADAPVNYDPITGADRMLKDLPQGGAKAAGTQTFSGTTYKVEEVSAPGNATAKILVTPAGRIPFVLRGPSMTGPGQMTWLELKELSFTAPPASVFVEPSGCTETKGTWSDTAVNAGATVSNTSSNSAPQEMNTVKIGNDTKDFINAIYPPMKKSTSSCEVIFRIVQGDAMTPLTSGFTLKLDTSPGFSGGHPRNVTGQLHGGTLRINNPPAHFNVEVDFQNGESNALIYRQCFGPKTTLLMVQRSTDSSKPDDWVWVKSGKWAAGASPHPGK